MRSVRASLTCCAAVPPHLHCRVKPAGSSQRGWRCTVSNGLPVVADPERLQLVGIVSRSDLVKPSLAHFDEEHKKERFRRLRIQPGKRHFPPRFRKSAAGRLPETDTHASSVPLRGRTSPSLSRLPH